ncbi:retropepsin-like aspartic protease [Flavobacterium silvaticum]|uniref:Clan AA aspartic protease n=1 Tax=Flavobacterium silvaticum TaxID=1852020 RepID=A0A972G1E4_9FLAO|nr:retropepsin-like aspartic protease [Flavobacterium silvaticum]NMH28671.1 clan AA aspartic protease [Flavobacterium silvaticum]
MKNEPQLILNTKSYQKTRFRITKTSHLLISATINGSKGDFILDTGASNSCVGFDQAEYFGLKTKDSKTKAAGAGAIDMLTMVSGKNVLKIGRWKNPDFNLVVFDLSHVNAALEQHKVKKVRGIIGADVLINGNAIIDYATKTLYLNYLK